MAANVRDRPASIIIPCSNRLESTRFGLPALVRHARRSWELIVIENGSTDGTRHDLIVATKRGRIYTWRGHE